MRIDRLGDGSPEVAVVAAIHGDEQSGVVALERLLQVDPPVERPVKLVTVANEPAYRQNKRYVDADLNRPLDGVPSDARERSIAERLRTELHGCRVLSLHSTEATAEPIVFVSDPTGETERTVRHLPVGRLVATGALLDGRPIDDIGGLLEVEVGRQGTRAAVENAFRIVLAYLGATGALPATTVPGGVERYELTEKVPKPPADEYETLVDNFERVDPGQAFARADGREILSTESGPFWPVVFSADGYDDIFGFKSERRPR
jgi:predicted deacylase